MLKCSTINAYQEMKPEIEQATVSQLWTESHRIVQLLCDKAIVLQAIVKVQGQLQKPNPPVHYLKLLELFEDQLETITAEQEEL
jgi:hypothetical protein